MQTKIDISKINSDRALLASGIFMMYSGPAEGLFFCPNFVHQMKEVKQPLDLDAQIDRLQNFHKLIIGKREDAKTILRRINYYRLSGYGLGLQKKDNHDEYQRGITLDDLYQLHNFDAAVKSALFQVIEEIELLLRSQISYTLAMRYGSLGYCDSKNFIFRMSKKSQIPIHSKIMMIFAGEIERQGNLPFVKHHIEIYGGKFPIWVAIELFTFGTLSSLFSIMKLKDQKSVANFFKTDVPSLSGWIQLLVEVRNICAHSGRLYNLPLQHNPRLYKEHEKFGSYPVKLFPVMLVIKRLICNEQHWNDFLSRFKLIMKAYENVVQLPFMGFPYAWEKILEEPLKYPTSFKKIKK